MEYNYEPDNPIVLEHLRRFALIVAVVITVSERKPISLFMQDESYHSQKRHISANAEIVFLKGSEFGPSATRLT